MTPANDTNWITRFSLSTTSNSNKVFSNGRQQIEISVSVTPKRGEIITEEQLDSIRLVTLDDDGNYQELTGELQTSAERNSTFEYYGSSGSAPSYLQLATSSRRKRIYVSSTRPGGSVDTIFATIRKDEHTYYASQTSLFNSFAIVESIAPTRMGRHEFDFERMDGPSEQLGTEHTDIDIYHLAFRNPRLKIVESITYGAAEHDPYYQENITIAPGGATPGGHAPAVNRCYAHVAYKVGREFEFRHKTMSVKINERQGVMDFLRLSFKVTGSELAAYTRPSRWGLLDQYGNEQKIEMTQTDSGNTMNFKMYD